MKIECDIISDLMPLYVDGICSDKSKTIVEDHLEECLSCKKKCEYMKVQISPTESLDSTEDPAIEKKIIKSEKHLYNRDFKAKEAFRKTRRRWVASILSVALAVSLAFPIVYLTRNTIRGKGIGFTNLYSYYCATQMMEAYINKDFEKAFSYMDTKAIYEKERDGNTPIDLSRGKLEYKATLIPIVLDGETFYMHELMLTNYIYNGVFTNITYERDKNDELYFFDSETQESLDKNKPVSPPDSQAFWVVASDSQLGGIPKNVLLYLQENADSFVYQYKDLLLSSEKYLQSLSDYEIVKTEYGEFGFIRHEGRILNDGSISDLNHLLSNSEYLRREKAAKEKKSYFEGLRLEGFIEKSKASFIENAKDLSMQEHQITSYEILSIQKIENGDGFHISITLQIEKQGDSGAITYDFAANGGKLALYNVDDFPVFAENEIDDAVSYFKIYEYSL